MRIRNIIANLRSFYCLTNSPLEKNCMEDDMESLSTEGTAWQVKVSNVWWSFCLSTEVTAWQVKVSKCGDLFVWVPRLRPDRLKRATCACGDLFVWVPRLRRDRLKRATCGDLFSNLKQECGFSYQNNSVNKFYPHSVAQRKNSSLMLKARGLQSIVKISWRFWCSTKMVARRTTLSLKHWEFCASVIFFLLVPESISFVLFKYSTSRLKHNYLKLILVRMIFTIFWSSQCSSCWKVF